MSANPTPWHIDGETIRDRDGGVVVSAINPCGVHTRRMIVKAVNAYAYAQSEREKMDNAWEASK